jgi:alpha-ketoglutarate-dependent taurine dioxygenase
MQTSLYNETASGVPGYHSKGSETDFLSTHDAWMKMSSDMQSTIKELRVIHNWTPEDLGPVSQEQLDAARYNGVPIDGMQTSLYNETASGVPGYNYPNLSFAGFVGMSQKEGKKLHKALWKAVNKEKWIHRQFWQDGQLVYMDQNITVHQRPTVKAETPLRQMTRTVSYMDRLYPGTGAATMFDWKGIKYTPAEFAILVDADRLRIFKEREAQEKR